MTDPQPARVEETYRGHTIIAGWNKGKPKAFVYSGATKASQTAFNAESVDGAISAARTWLDDLQGAARAERRADNVGTVDQYVEAFGKRPPKERELEMLRAHARAGVITTGELAKAAGYPRHSTANLQYGALGHAIADLLGLEPTLRPDGTPCWITVLATGLDGASDRSAEYRWEIHPELAEALAAAHLMPPLAMRRRA